MRILVIGSGGREHALVWKLAQSPLVNKIYCAPGNGGTAALGENCAVKEDDIPGLTALAADNRVDLVVVGPELPLVLGIKESLSQKGIACFGPGAFAAQLEGSKAFSKTLMQTAGVPTAAFAVFDDYESARAHVLERTVPCVVKADGLAAGKGVVVCTERDQALQALEDMMHKQCFGAAGERVVIEDALAGEEASFLAFCDGEHIVAMPSSQDHKAVGEGDTGPNTGGMGAYSPAPVLPEKAWEQTADTVIRPITEHLAGLGQSFCGVLYAGLMYTAQGPFVLEYNVRFGDPECQPLLTRLDSDLAAVMLACTQGRLDEIDIRWKQDSSVCVVMAAQGYPAHYPTGMPVTGIEQAGALEGVHIFQAGTRQEAQTIVSSGGRILGVTALGTNLEAARKQAYKAVDLIHFENSYIRRDIGNKGIADRP